MFGNQELIAINISDASLEAIIVRQIGQGTSVHSWSRVELPEGIIEQGRIVDKDKAKKALQELLQKGQPQKMTAKEVALTLPENVVFTQVVTLPISLKPAEIKELLWQKATEVIPIEPTQMVADYFLSNGKETKEAVVVATYSQLVDDYVRLAASLNLKVRLFSTESVSLARSITSAADEQAHLILDIGEEQTIALIAARGIVLESINIAVAGKQMTDSLMQSQKISALEAEKLKSEIGLTAEPSAVILQRTLQSLLVEVRMLMNFWQKRSGQKISQLEVTGGSGSMPGLVAYLTSNLGLTARLAAPDSQYKVQGQDQISPKFLPVLGLALTAQSRDSTINFIEPKLKTVGIKAPAVESVKRNPAVNKIISTKSTSGRVPVSRVIILSVFFLVACAIFAYIWWQNTPSTGLVIPPTNTMEENRELSLKLWVSHLDSGQAAPTAEFAAIQGSVAEISLGGSLALDQEFWQRLDSQIPAENRNELTSWAPLASTLVVERLWQQERERQASEIQQSGSLLLGDVMDTTLVTTQPDLLTISYGQEANVTINARLTVLTASRQRLYESVAVAWQRQMGNELSPNFVLADSNIGQTINDWSLVDLTIIN